MDRITAKHSTEVVFDRLSEGHANKGATFLESFLCIVLEGDFFFEYAAR